MLGIRFIKTKPTDYVLLYKRGRIKARGNGLSFWYYEPTTSLVVVPADSRDIPFIFKDISADFQEINIQGQLTYSVQEPEKLAALLDFTIDRSGKPLGDGAEKLAARLTNLIQVVLREKLQNMDLATALSSSRELVAFATERLQKLEAVMAMGLSILDFSIIRLSPTPDMARALESGTREKLLQSADQAIYERRNFAVEQERLIKENELRTAIAVEEKNRQIREEQMNIEIAVAEKQALLKKKQLDAQAEEVRQAAAIARQKLLDTIDRESERKRLVDAEATNLAILSQARAESMQRELGALREVPLEILSVLAANQMDSRDFISKALGDLAKSAQKIGTLNITPDLLHSLLESERA